MRSLLSSFINTEEVMVPSEIPIIPYDRKPSSFEVAISLFENCNLKCKFCFEGKKEKKIDIDYILSIPEKVFQDIQGDVIKSEASTLTLRLWGGELFYDALPNSLFQVYKDFFDKCKELKEKYLPDVELKFYWLSNGIFTKHERILDLLEYTNAVIGFSYDPIDRFSSEKQKSILKKNIEIFRNVGQLACMSITLTKPTLEAYIAGDSFYEQLPEDLQISVNFYTPGNKWEDLVLDDEILFEYYKWGVDNYKFNIPIISSFVKYCIPELRPLVSRHCDCKFSKQFSKNDCTYNCVKRASCLPLEDFFGKYAKDLTEKNCCEIKNSLGIKKRGCLLCPHYENCHMTCFISFIFKGYKITECPIKRIYKYIESHKTVKEEYLKWREKYANNHFLAL